MKYLDYDKLTGKVLGWYDNEIHGDNIPLNSVEISDEIWEETINRPIPYMVDLTITDKIVFIDIPMDILPNVLNLEERLTILENQILLNNTEGIL